jgi:ergothioneine biosynthesis protein EgtB
MNKLTLLETYQSCRSLSETICAPIESRHLSIQVAKFASPVKWHLAHTTWFFEEMILKELDDYKEFDTAFSYLFNSYYNSIGERIQQDSRGSITNTIEEVYAYRKHVDTCIEKLISKVSIDAVSDRVKNLIETGINHEQQHQELMYTDIKITLFKDGSFPMYDLASNLLSDEIKGEKTWLKKEEGVYIIGHQGDAFCYDNEKGNHKVYLQEFEIAEQLVTVGEYQAFIQDGGYTKSALWLDEGWKWVTENNIETPMYWMRKGDNWKLFTLAGLCNLEPNQILSHVSFYEANAFATWKGVRLATEFEWEVASDELSWGSRWEWTYSAYLPYPGFKIATGALGEYNGKFMINQMVLRGASSATSPNHSRNTYRNFFSADTQWQFSGIRLVK